MRSYEQPTGMAQIQNSEGTKCWWGCKWNPPLSLWECRMAAAPLENTFTVSYKIKYTLAIWPKDPILRDLQERNEDIHPYKNLFANVNKQLYQELPQTRK